jgi:hypothetical protein
VSPLRHPALVPRGGDIQYANATVPSLPQADRGPRRHVPDDRHLASRHPVQARDEVTHACPITLREPESPAVRRPGRALPAMRSGRQRQPTHVALYGDGSREGTTGAVRVLRALRDAPDRGIGRRPTPKRSRVSGNVQQAEGLAGALGPRSGKAAAIPGRAVPIGLPAPWEWPATAYRRPACAIDRIGAQRLAGVRRSTERSLWDMALTPADLSRPVFLSSVGCSAGFLDTVSISALAALVLLPWR